MPDRADTSMGPGGAKFRSTVWDCLQTLRDPDGPDSREAFDRIVRWYWRPVYRCIRLGWNKTNDEAKDLTQAFFTWLLQRDVLAKADPARGKFRTFLKTALRNFIAQDHRNAHTIKRGGEHSILPTDFQSEAPELEAPPSSSPEEAFELEWARSLLSAALDRLKESMKGERELHYRVFEQGALHDANVPDPTHQELAGRFSLSAGEVKRSLKSTRSRLHDLVVEEIRKYAQNDEEVWQERDYLIALWRKRGRRWTPRITS